MTHHARVGAFARGLAIERETRAHGRGRGRGFRGIACVKRRAACGVRRAADERDEGGRR
ncbi:flagellar biosynthesis protein FlgF [Burkholderia pseudomallei]|nr:flagellar biosynthesis protein FlgF [Burkholderia pseudomallei]OND80548.1 flagellar biosynthesis protein FlgF [Burkholderia pseudomallei]